ncbi:MAG: ferredoxin [Gemmatimonadetes bacterium]|nr:ferredoxin [Gemmatimonadota bacterium]NIO33257.1 ferredoxin [Gemmatimonadota bacterium]
MKAHYGYKDGAGDFFIIIDTDKCAECEDRRCASACPEGVLEIITDDYDDQVAAVVEDHRKKIKYSCAPCKPDRDRAPLPCMAACAPGALEHSW